MKTITYVYRGLIDFIISLGTVMLLTFFVVAVFFSSCSINIKQTPIDNTKAKTEGKTKIHLGFSLSVKEDNKEEKNVTKN